MVNPKKKGKFLRQCALNLKRLGMKWRKPRGEHNKLLRRKKGREKRVAIGFGAPRNLRYLHPSGLKEVRVENVNQLPGINPKTEAARISHSVSKRKKQEILKKAEELKIKVLNP